MMIKARENEKKRAGNTCGCGCEAKEAIQKPGVACGCEDDDDDDDEGNGGCGCEHHHHCDEDDGGGHEHHHHHCDDDGGCGHDHGISLHCGCGCEDEEEEGDRKTRILRFIVGGGLFALGMIVKFPVLLYVAYVVFGYDVLWRAVKNISRGKVFDENFLMALATIGALALGDTPEAVFVMAFYQLGEFFQDLAVDKSKSSIESLMAIRPDFARRLDGTEVAPEEIALGESFVVRPGERIPLDGLVLDGTAWLDTAAVTGESVPRQVHPGDEVVSGCVATDGSLTLKALRPFGESTVMRILKMTQDASEHKSRAERFITRFARVYTPAVVMGAVALALIPSLITGNPGLWVGRALTFLVISCPCALVLSVPLSVFSGIGEASRSGVLVKSGQDLEALQEIEILAMDKTGTLTEGVFGVREVVAAAGGDKDRVLRLAARAESGSNHPIARALWAAGGQPDPEPGIREISGRGVEVMLDGKRVLAGNRRLLAENNIAVTTEVRPGTQVNVAEDGVYVGTVYLEDTIRRDVPEALALLRKCGVKRFVMLSGDAQATADRVAQSLGIDEAFGELLPQDKAERIRELKQSGQTVAYAGDGINDAPSLALADVGVAMGGVGSDAAMEAADVVVMQDDLRSLATGMQIARGTNRIVKQNVVFALVIKALTMVLGAMGLVGLWAASFADVGVALLAILNAMRKKH